MTFQQQPTEPPDVQATHATATAPRFISRQRTTTGTDSQCRAGRRSRNAWSYVYGVFEAITSAISISGEETKSSGALDMSAAAT